MGRWLVRAWGVFATGIPQDIDNISHAYDTEHDTACGLGTYALMITERKFETLVGTRPHRCKNCERVLAARKMKRG